MATEEDIAWFKSTFHPIPKAQLPDDSVEYYVYHLPSPAPAVIDQAVETRARLLEVQRTAAELTKELLKDYIWQRENFRLEITKDDGITSLHGRTNYGDSIEDEWVVVYILRELTKRHKDIWVKVGDSDGEFLLVEAAGTLPAWLEPEVADNRVWINQGDLKIIKPKKDTGKKVSETLTLPEAHKIIQEEPNRFIRSRIIQEEAFYRLRNYPKQISENLHHAIVTLPRKVAHLLHRKPAYISPVVEAFYIRDPIAMRPLKSKDASDLVFKPEDFVTVSLKFTRVGYAQLKSQEFPTPSTWEGTLPPPEDLKAYARAETGMKVSCGLEMLLYDPHHQDKTSVREMKIWLEDIDDGEEHLTGDLEIERDWDKREDDEKWLDINFEDLDRELKGGKSEEKTGGDFGDVGAQQNLQRIVARFEEFLNDNSAGFDGADFIDDFGSDSDVDDDDEDELSSDGEDKDASFDEEEFSRMMKEMMGMPSGPGKPSFKALGKRVQELDADEEDDTEQIKELSRQMEAELRGTGVLDLNRKQQKLASGENASKGKATEPNNPDDQEDYDEDENSNINLAKNLLESLHAQAGTAGPAGNMLSMMGLRLPKDDRH
ncbi:hypothetical protein N7448_006836 [Penicillium atrosanguineum]|uniref:Regulatory factor Sgt1 n=1 Tax=Penicillium atrosanguineum TaxID=1132637 RepID=A0A9W9U228_9EURO|nr:uncharacterized protein N7443_010597 [Penicillium atrosanguineum]KAJ5132678.1 hypothetical protein N7448_006836 [Penicillium atrosanguineum]KAJ5141437.1 hypothetical protein N7526_002432 [Penicillium atrosanguineum]KAJ5290344.1 hypothetical protein N7443_010597 [Penicillium atrosanguineum]KAJ5308167.1 hypothetical protein N7476_008823 [Penicillium atrosanguineum]